LGRSLQESTVVVVGTEVNGGALFDSVSEILMDLLFDITAGERVIFLDIFTLQNFPDLTYYKVIIFFPFIPNFRMKAVWPRYFIFILFADG